MPALATRPAVSDGFKNWASAKVDTVVSIGKAAAGKAKYVGAAATGFAIQARAEVPAEVDAALATMKVDGMKVAGLVLVAIIAVAAFKFIKKAM